MSLICGIDPGVSGAVGVIDQETGLHVVFDIPCLVSVTRKRKRRSIDAEQLFYLMREFKNEISAVYLEHVQPMPTNGCIASFSLGQSFGIIIGILSSLGIPIYYIRPPVWKKHFDLLKKPKEESLFLAQIFFEHKYLYLKKHHNRAEALLLAQYGIDTEKGQ